MATNGGVCPGSNASIAAASEMRSLIILLMRVHLTVVSRYHACSDRSPWKATPTMRGKYSRTTTAWGRSRGWALRNAERASRTTRCSSAMRGYASGFSP